jgi:DNA-binding transcriptional LysR family regulator
MSPMPSPIARLDLNLLKLFKAVYDLRQTTAAADRLGLTQPAVSQGLKRLREHIGDPLFVPTRAGMDPTPRAREMAGPIADALAAIERTLERPPVFEPAAARRRFRLGMLDYGVMVLAPKLATEIAARAPGVNIDIEHVSSGAAAESLEAGRFDLVTGPFRAIPRTMSTTPLFKDRFVVISHRRHPGLAAGLTRKHLITSAYVDVPFEASAKRGIDAVLAAAGASRRKAMTVPTFSGACFVVASSPLLAIVPERIANAHREICDLDIHPMPLRLPMLSISALTHRKQDADSGLVWLRDLLVSMSS